MLVLSRKPGEQIQIDSNITVTVLGVEGKRIRLGIDAPREVPIVRMELKGVLDEPTGPVSYQPDFADSEHPMVVQGAAWDI